MGYYFSYNGYTFLMDKELIINSDNWVSCMWGYPTPENIGIPEFVVKGIAIKELVYADWHPTCPYVIVKDYEDNYWGSYFTGSEMVPKDGCLNGQRTD